VTSVQVVERMSAGLSEGEGVILLIAAVENAREVGTERVGSGINIAGAIAVRIGIWAIQVVAASATSRGGWEVN